MEIIFEENCCEQVRLLVNTKILITTVQSNLIPQCNVTVSFGMLSYDHGDILYRTWSPRVSAGMVKRPMTEYNIPITPQRPIIPRSRSWNMVTTCSTTPPRQSLRHSIPGTHCTGWAAWTTAPTPRSNRYF